MVLDENAHKEVIERIIESQMKLLGPLAITKAKDANGLEITDEGKVVSISGNPILVLRNLVLKYEEIAGRAAAAVCKIAIVELKKKHPDLELPPELT